MTVSLCMIVRDEEAVLGRCLESIREAVDEIVIVDTGSADGTKAVAARYTDKIFDFPWCDDFAAARNFAFSKGTGDFLLWLDADDVILPEDLRRFLALKETLDGDTDVVMLPYHTRFDEEGRPTFSYDRERLIRRTLPHRWVGFVHEVVSHRGRVRTGDAAVTHKSAKKSYSRRNLDIYEAHLQAGETLSPRDEFYYGRELYYHGAYERAEEVLRAFLDGGQGWVENCIDACRVLADCYRARGRVYDAMAALGRSFRYDAPRPEVCCDMGALWIALREYRAAATWYEMALCAPPCTRQGGFCDEECRGYVPYLQLCVCWDRLGEWEKAAEYNRLAGRIRPKAAPYLQNVAYFAVRRMHAAGEGGID